MTSSHTNNKDTRSVYLCLFLPDSAKLPAVQSAVGENIPRNLGEKMDPPPLFSFLWGTNSLNAFY